MDKLEGIAYIFFLGITAWFMYLMVTAWPAPMMEVGSKCEQYTGEEYLWCSADQRMEDALNR